MKWTELRDKGIKAIGGAVSGGLDSCTATNWLNEKVSDFDNIWYFYCRVS